MDRNEMVDTTEAEPGTTRAPRWRAVALTAALALGVSLGGVGTQAGGGRTAALAKALEARGLAVDAEATLWLELPPVGLWRAAVGSVPVVVRAAPGPEEPNDIYLVEARLSPEGVLLDVGRHFNLTETSAVDEQRPVGHGLCFAFVERGLIEGSGEGRIRFVDVGSPAPSAEVQAGASRAREPSAETNGEPSGAEDPTRGEDETAIGRWTRLQRLQAAITRWQQTGRVAGIARWSIGLEPAPTELRIAATADGLAVVADARRATIPWSDPRAVPEWLQAEPMLDAKPGNLVTWAVDRVRAVVGDETMQYIKALAFSALDVVLRGKQAVTDDTGAEEIAIDLGQEALGPATRTVPVDPDIGFPPPSLEPWVTPALAGEGEWNAQPDDPFIASAPGLPPAFVTTFIRGDRMRKATRIYIALWDPRQVELHTMAGVAEPKSATGETGPGTIPREPTVMRRLAAACNAGFQSLHGEFGMMSDGVIYLPPKPYAATVATLRDGSTAFGTWPKDLTIPSEILSFRQNLTPLVLDGKFNPYGRTWWGGTPSDWEDKTHTVRTGICLTRENFVGYFYGAELSPESLGRAMLQARCVHGIALDMNAGHSGLEFYRVAPAAELPVLDRPMTESEREGDVPGLDGWRFRARRLIRGMGLMYFPRYIKREGRDYFYLTLRPLLPGPPLVAAEGAAPVPWEVKGLPQHGFPYALARADVSVSPEREARVLLVDPRVVALRGAPPSAAVPGSAPAADAAAVLAIVAPEPVEGEKSPMAVWASPDAFALGADAPVPGAVALASGTALASSGAGDAAAALGVQTEAGMLVYVEAGGAAVADAGAKWPAAELQALLGRLGVDEAVLLPERLELALGGDTSLDGQPVRLGREGRLVELVRKPGPGARTMFADTPIVPLGEWYPLQAKRIRYFKKKAEDKSAEPAAAP